MRLKANVISDTQQEPSADRSVAVMKKKKKKEWPGPLLHSSDSLSIKYPKRQMVMMNGYEFCGGDQMEVTIKSSEETKCGRG